MNKRIFTGNYEECKAGNLISISGDRGRKIGFIGKAMPKLAPKKGFWTTFNNNIGKIPKEENIGYYIEEYFKQVLSKVDIEELLGTKVFLNLYVKTMNKWRDKMNYLKELGFYDIDE